MKNPSKMGFLRFGSWCEISSKKNSGHTPVIRSKPLVQVLASVVIRGGIEVKPQRWPVSATIGGGPGRMMSGID